MTNTIQMMKQIKATQLQYVKLQNQLNLELTGLCFSMDEEHPDISTDALNMSLKTYTASKAVNQLLTNLLNLVGETIGVETSDLAEPSFDELITNLPPQLQKQAT